VIATPSAAVALEQALERAALPLPFPLPVERMRGGSHVHLGVFWEGSPDAVGLAAEQSSLRRDDPGSRPRRDYRLRREHFTATVSRPGKDEGGEDVP
jgi:hypothetical protein